MIRSADPHRDCAGRLDDPDTGSCATACAADSRLFQALDDYMQALDAGRPPLREEFLSRYADIRSELTACLDGLAFVHSVAKPLHASGTPLDTPDDCAEPGQDNARPLGDFKLVRELGRGGMGVVYEAIQVSLGRRVAVKVLPFAAALHPRYLQRFHNEAQAAAHLHHPNIVPVYAVGCDRSVHYYAMQLIDGQSLAEVIRQMRAAAPSMNRIETQQGPGAAGRFWVRRRFPPSAAVRFHPPHHAATGLDNSSAAAQDHSPGGLSEIRTRKRSAFFQAVARLGLQAVEALEYAHQQGVVHRDIKPENLILDSSGKLWVTDFGLAQFYADAEGGLTQTGDLLGTLRYMSPEQASGRFVVLDQRTDVYSLGLTLYELMTLERAIPGDNREQLLRRIDVHEPRPPRSIDPSVPCDLETILAKAAAKDAAERYPSARAMADDLRRFLNDEPILARPPSVSDKAIKWMRRHRTVAASAVAILVLTAVGFLISTLLIAREQNRTKAALIREQERAAEATAQRMLAERRYDRAREAVDFIARIAEDMDRSGRWDEAPWEMLEVALAYYQDFISDRNDDPALAKDLAESRRRVSTILGDLSVWQNLFRVTTRAELLPEPSVRRALGLDSSPETDGTAGFVPGFWSRMTRGRDPRRMQPAERLESLTRVADQIEAELNAILTPVQGERLRQIHRQLRGVGALDDPDVVEHLALTRQQRAAIRELAGKPELHMIGRRAIDQHVMARALAVLTPAQREEWSILVGQPFKETVFRPDDRRSRGGHGDTPG